MPKIVIPIKNGYPAQSLVAMAEGLGRLTGTVVECNTAVEITANDAVIKALTAIAPMAKGKRTRKGAASTAGEEESPEAEM